MRTDFRACKIGQGPVWALNKANGIYYPVRGMALSLFFGKIRTFFPCMHSLVRYASLNMICMCSRALYHHKRNAVRRAACHFGLSQWLATSPTSTTAIWWCPTRDHHAVPVNSLTEVFFVELRCYGNHPPWFSQLAIWVFRLVDSCRQSHDREHACMHALNAWLHASIA